MSVARYRDLKTAKLVDPQNLGKCKQGYLIERPVDVDFDGSPIWSEDQKIQVHLTLTQEDARGFLFRLNLLQHLTGLDDQLLEVHKQVEQGIYNPRKVCDKELENLKK